MSSRSSMIFHTVLVGIFVFLLLVSFSSSFQRVVFPVIVLSIGILVSLLKLLSLARPQWKALLDPEGMFESMGKQNAPVGQSLEDRDEDSGLVTSAPKTEKLSLASVMIWIVVTMTGIILFGFPIGSALSTLVYMGVLSHEKWLPTVITSVLVGVSLHLVFTVALQVEPYAGVLFG